MRRPSAVRRNKELAFRKFSLFALLHVLSSALAEDIELYGEIPPGSEWLATWLGVYDENEGMEQNGRPTYSKRNTDGKILWYTGSYWHFGYPYDIARGAAMIAAKSDARTPGQVDETWSAASFGGDRIDTKLVCNRAPAASIWLFGHGPFGRRHVAAWLGVYDFEDDAVLDGRPIYRHRSCSLAPGEPCVQTLWWSRAAGSWLLGWDEGGSWERLHGYFALSNASSGGQTDPLALPYMESVEPTVIWRARSSDGRWVDAPGIRCTSDASKVIGFYESVAQFYFRASDPGVGPASNQRDSAPGLSDAYDDSPCEDLGPQWRFLVRAAASTSRLPWRGLARAAPLIILLARLADGVAELFDRFLPASATKGRGRLLEPGRITATAKVAASLLATEVSLAALLLTLAAWACVMLLFMAIRRRMGWAETDGDYEDEGDDSKSEAQSSEEKRLAFTCLSGAIEDVKDKINEQQYVALYSAALWCFNLTPQWAEGVPTPPTTEAVANGPAPACAAPGSVPVPVEGPMPTATQAATVLEDGSQASSSKAAATVQVSPGSLSSKHIGMAEAQRTLSGGVESEQHGEQASTSASGSPKDATDLLRRRRRR